MLRRPRIRLQKTAGAPARSGHSSLSGRRVASESQAAIHTNPPSGVIIPNFPTSLSTSAYKLPLNKTRPSKNRCATRRRFRGGPKGNAASAKSASEWTK